MTLPGPAPMELFSQGTAMYAGGDSAAFFARYPAAIIKYVSAARTFVTLSFSHSLYNAFLVTEVYPYLNGKQPHHTVHLQPPLTLVFHSTLFNLLLSDTIVYSKHN